jgi:molecular chaperone GrpE
MDSTGKPFDVNLHDALMQVPDGKTPANTIIDTVERGYYLKDKVIRHAKVLVSSNPEAGEGDEKAEQ